MCREYRLRLRLFAFSTRLFVSCSGKFAIVLNWWGARLTTLYWPSLALGIGFRIASAPIAAVPSRLPARGPVGIRMPDLRSPAPTVGTAGGRGGSGELGFFICRAASSY